MRRFLISTCLVALCLGGPSRVVAEVAQGCDMLCRVTGYLATDHMTAAPVETEALPAKAPGKRRLRAARAAPGVAAANPAGRPKSAVAKPTSKTARKESTGATPLLAEKPAVPSKGAVAAEANKTAPKMATEPAARPRPVAERPATRVVKGGRKSRVASSSAVHRPAAVISETLAAAPPRPAPADGPKMASNQPLARASARHHAPEPQTRTADAVIPGSSPTVAAGFRPLGAAALGEH